MTTWSELLPRRRSTPVVEFAQPAADVAVAPAVPTRAFLPRTIRRVVELNGQPMTAFQISRAVLKWMPNRWSARTIEKAAGCRAGLEVVDCDGVSPNHAPCYRYRLGDS